MTDLQSVFTPPNVKLQQSPAEFVLQRITTDKTNSVRLENYSKRTAAPLTTARRKKINPAHVAPTNQKNLPINKPFDY